MKMRLSVTIIALLASILLHLSLILIVWRYVQHSPASTHLNEIKSTPALNLYFYVSQEEKKIKKAPLLNTSKTAHPSRHVEERGHQNSSSRHSQSKSNRIANSNQLNDVISILHAAIQAHQKYPQEARALREEGEAVVGFDLHMNGKFTNVHLIQSSGIKSIDKAALEAVSFASPVNLSEESIQFLHENSNHFELKIAFKLHESV